MLDILFNLFKSNNLSKLTSVLGIIENLVTTFEAEFAEDKNAKNAAIDTIIKLLESHKSQ